MLIERVELHDLLPGGAGFGGCYLTQIVEIRIAGYSGILGGSLRIGSRPEKKIWFE